LPAHLATVVTGPFDRTVVVLGALLVVGALSAGIARRSFLSLTALFVLAGFVLGHGGLGVLHFDARSAFVADLAKVALILILFRDGLEVEAEMLQKAWHLPLRKLAIAMPLTVGLIALFAHAVVGLDWTESFLVGALLSPTDPVLSSSVVTNPLVPRIVRHSLNLESGLNDGLALPAVLALIAALTPSSGHFDWVSFVLRDIGFGLTAGIGFGLVASWLLPRPTLARVAMPIHTRALYGLGVAFACYGATVYGPKGNGLIAVFVCAITLGVRRPDLRSYFESQAGAVVEIAKLGIFVVFGSLLTVGELFGGGWAAVALVVFVLVVARSAALAVALWRTETDWATRTFMAWFGPKGVATMTFSLLVLASNIRDGTRIFHLAALVVFASILAHGVTDAWGANWLARRTAAGVPAEGEGALARGLEAARSSGGR
jgi:NhaP-type Na+/H+ or K+/H+ antiporter